MESKPSKIPLAEEKRPSSPTLSTLCSMKHCPSALKSGMLSEQLHKLSPVQSATNTSYQLSWPLACPVLVAQGGLQASTLTPPVK